MFLDIKAGENYYKDEMDFNNSSFYTIKAGLDFNNSTFYTINFICILPLVTEKIYGCIRKNKSFCCKLCWGFSVLEAYIDAVPIDFQANIFLGKTCI